MKAQISYTVDFEDIPREVDGLLVRASAFTNDALILLKQIPTNETGNSLDDSLVLIEQIRQQLARADIVLADCDAILKGFLQTKHGLNQASVSQGESEGD